MNGWIHITSEGGYLKRKGTRFVYQTAEGNRHEQSALEIEKIIIEANIQISIGAIHLASEYNIDVVMFNSFGKYLGRIQSGTMEYGVTTKKDQYYWLNNRELKIRSSCNLIESKLKGQARLLTKIIEYDSTQQLVEARDTIKKLAKASKSFNELDQIMGIEGAAAAVYWKAFGSLLPEEFDFSKRVGRGAEDTINSALNYGYAVLNSSCLKALYIAGLDPGAGFLHQDRPGKPSLSLDLMEIFRTVLVDAVVLKLARRRQLQLISLRKPWLDDPTKKVLIQSLKERLDKRFNYYGEQCTLNSIMVQEAWSIARATSKEDDLIFWKWGR